MGKIQVETCEIEGLKVITPTVFGDERGYFMETYNYNDFKEAGIDQEFVQDNQSSSKKGVLRGLHFQINYPQDKLVRVVNGAVFDVADMNLLHIVGKRKLRFSVLFPFLRLLPSLRVPLGLPRTSSQVFRTSPQAWRAAYFLC